MSYPVWPSELPHPERNTWSAAPQDARRKRGADTGPKGYGRRFSSTSRTVRLSVLLTRDLKGVFERFFYEEIAQGVGLFWMPDVTTDGWGLKSSDGEAILISGGPQDGQPILLSRMWLVTMGDELPAETVVGVEFRYTFSIEVMP